MTVIYGQKIGMTTVFDKTGRAIPCTVVLALPNVVVGKRMVNDQHQVIIGFGPAVKKLPLSVAGQFKATGQPRRFLGSGRTEAAVGDKITAADFKVNAKVSITGVSKGKGFAGVIKRHGFARGPQTHGSDHHRATGAIGSAYPQRTLPGRRGPGRMGNQRTTLRNRVVVAVLPEKNLIQIKGPLPGPNKSYVRIESND